MSILLNSGLKPLAGYRSWTHDLLHRKSEKLSSSIKGMIITLFYDAAHSDSAILQMWCQHKSDVLRYIKVWQYSFDNMFFFFSKVQ